MTGLAKNPRPNQGQISPSAGLPSTSPAQRLLRPVRQAQPRTPFALPAAGFLLRTGPGAVAVTHGEGSTCRFRGAGANLEQAEPGFVQVAHSSRGFAFEPPIDESRGARKHFRQDHFQPNQAPGKESQASRKSDPHRCGIVHIPLLVFSSGSRTINFVFPGSDCTSMVPPNFCVTMRCTISSPRPVPEPCGLVVKNASKMRGSASGAMPSP